MAEKATKKAPAKKAPAAKQSASSSSSVELGDMVTVLVDPRSNNGSDEAPAIVTRVLDSGSDQRVNVEVLLDDHGSKWSPNVLLLGSKPDADEEIENVTTSGGVPQVAW